MAEITTAEYAARHGVSRRRVQAAAAAGTLTARRVGAQWLVDDATPHRGRPGRPLSRRSVRAVECRLSGSPDWANGLSRSERGRIQERIAELRADPMPWQRIVNWTRTEYREPSGYQLAAADLEDLRADSRLVRAGVSDPRSGISDAGFLEAHVAEDDLATVQREYLLVATDSRPNVLLHISAERPSDPLPLGTLIIELAHHDGARERAAARSLLDSAL